MSQKLAMRVKRIAGFTLIEVMVVLVIMGVLIGLVSTNFAPDDRQQLQLEGHKLALLLSHASNTARTTGMTVAWKSTPKSYTFLTLAPDGRNWNPLLNDSDLYARHMSEGMRISKVSIAGDSTSDMVIFSPSGLNSDFNVTLSSDQYRLNVHGNLLGKVEDLTATEIQR